MTENYGNMPAQLLDRIGWRHLNWIRLQKYDDNVFRHYIEFHMALHCDNITNLLRQIYQFWTDHLNTLRQLVLHSTVRSPRGLNYELTGFAFSIASILSQTNSDEEANAAPHCSRNFLMSSVLLM